MEFHLPFFALRKALTSNGPPPTVRAKRLREWEDLTLLTRDKTGSKGQEIYRLYKAQMSCVIHGFDGWHWVAYAFEDTQQDRKDDGNGVGKTIFSQGIHEDPISCRLDADNPI